MGCVSSNEVKENDPPIEKAEAAPQVQSIPEIQISGPPSGAKENGVSNHNNTATPPSTPQKTAAAVPEPVAPETPVKEPEPLFPHVSPFKPQFDPIKDVALSPRASRYLEQNGGAATGKAAAAGGKSVPEWEEDTTCDVTGGAAEGEDNLDDTYTERDVLAQPEEEEGGDAPSSPAVDASQVQLQTELESTKQPEKSAESETTPAQSTEQQSEAPEERTEPEAQMKQEEDPKAVESAPAAADTTPQNEEASSPAAALKQEEDRSAILAAFLANQDSPDALGSSEDENGDNQFHFAPRDNEDPDFLANQVTDEEQMNESEKPSSGESGEGDHQLSALEKCKLDAAGDSAGDKDVEVHFSEEDRTKLNDLLNEIESIAEKNGRFN